MRTGAAKTAIAFMLYVLGWLLTSVLALGATSCPIPLDKGTQWTYEGKVEWTLSGSATVKTAQIRWVTKVVDCIKGSKAQAAVVRGFPDELMWYEPSRSPSFSVLLSVSNHVYRLRAEGEDQAGFLARQLIRNPRQLPQTAEALLELPLALGRTWGQDPGREDTWYGWCVEQVQAKALPVRGFASKRPLKTYQLAYRTCPDHQLLDIAPGLGIVRFVYHHHGTVASTDVHLVSVSKPGKSVHDQPST